MSFLGWFYVAAMASLGAALAVSTWANREQHKNFNNLLSSYKQMCALQSQVEMQRDSARKERDVAREERNQAQARFADAVASGSYGEGRSVRGGPPL